MLAEIYFLRLEAMARASEEAIKQTISLRSAETASGAAGQVRSVRAKVAPQGVRGQVDQG